MPHYCLFRSNERVHELKGCDPCRACDVRSMAVINDGKKYEDFPKGCQYYTEDLAAVQAAVEAWVKDACAREDRLSETRKRYE